MIPAHLTAILTAARKMGLGSSLLQALAYLSTHEEVSLGELGRHLGVSTAAITGIADKLEKRGYAHRRVGTDRRAFVLTLTRDGHKAISHLANAATTPAG